MSGSMKRQEMRTKTSGFTLVELLMVVAIIGVLSAIAVPNLLMAMHRAKQKRTMSDMRNIATAWESRATDVGRYNAAGAADVIASIPIPIADLQTYLEPTYIKSLPLTDAWGTIYRCFTDVDFTSGPGASKYTIVSAGRDKEFSDPMVMGSFGTYDCDIIFATGSFQSFP